MCALVPQKFLEGRHCIEVRQQSRAPSRGSRAGPFFASVVLLLLVATLGLPPRDSMSAFRVPGNCPGVSVPASKVPSSYQDISPCVTAPP